MLTVVTNGAVRLVTGTVKSGRVSFNQVTLLTWSTDPAEIVLFAIDPGQGIYVWHRKFAEVDARAHTQAAKYSRTIGTFDPQHPPEYLGPPKFTPRDGIDNAVWTLFLTARTNALKKAAKEYLGL